MSILSKIGAAISALLNRHKSTVIDKAAVLGMIDGNLIALDSFDRVATSSPDKLRKLYTAITQNEGSDRKTAVIIAAAYLRFSQQLDYKIKNQEAKRFLSGLAVAVKMLRNDHNELKDKFVEIFGVDEATLTLEETKVTHAIILGYLERVRRAMEWINLVIGLANYPSEDHPPGYMLEIIQNHTDKVAGTFNTTARRGMLTLLGEIDRVKRAGGDVFVITQGTTLDHYAHDSDFHGVADEMLGFTMNPITLIQNGLILWSRMFYDWNVETRDWVTTRMALLQLQLQGVSEDSPEYQRLLKIYQRYTAQLATLEEKIRRYENP